jgi:lipopolysaccharide biosynthesis regulator YciM
MDFDRLDEIIAEQEKIQGKEVIQLIRDVGKASDVAWDDPCFRCEECGAQKESNYISCSVCGAGGW